MASQKKMKPEMNSNPSLPSSSDAIGKVVVAVDRISNLPDCITAIILSQLPVEESARTSVLSKQWRRQWLLSPICIDDKSLFGICDQLTSSEEEFISLCVQTITRILVLHPGPIRFCRFAYSFWLRHCLTLTRLVQILTQKGIRQLEICMEDHIFDLPRCVLECEALLVLRLENNRFPEHLPRRIFPNLKRLHMWSTDIEHHTLSNLLSCSSITHLEIADCYRLKQVIVESNSLKMLAVPDTGNIEKLVIRHTPNLESLIIVDLMIEDLELTILNAPKLRILDCIFVSISSLRLGESQFDRTDNLIKFSSFSTHFQSLTTLAIKVHFSFVNQGKSLLYLLRCFPCLESLEVLIGCARVDDMNSSPYGDYWEQHFDIDCLDHHLKYVHLEGYSGEQSQVDFANFIISRARVLKTMTLICGSKWKKEQWVETQKQRLLLGNRASPAAQVVFGKPQRLQTVSRIMRSITGDACWVF